jgi:hypothetical protein
MSTYQNSVKKTKRIHWMDNLRVVIIALVVLYHAGGVYESAGLWGWFWIIDDPNTFMASGFIGIMFDTFVMPTIFFIAGYLVPASLKNKTPWQFIGSKAKRLLLPWVLAVVTLIPLYKVIFLYSRGLPQENWTTYFHITNPNSQNWLWFLPLLFTFNLLYLLIDKAGIKFSKISLPWAVVGTVLISIVSSYFIGSWLGFRSWTLTPLIDFENERLLAHFLIFLLGVLAYNKDLFAKLPEKKTLYTIGNSVAWLPITGHIFVRLWPFFVPGFEVTPIYRMLWFLSFHLSTLVMVYVMVESFWRYLDKYGKVWQELNKNSYGVYIIHVVMIGVFGALLLMFNIPGWLKYISLIILAYGSSNLLVSLYRRAKIVLISSNK